MKNVDNIRLYYPEYFGFQKYPADQCAVVHKIDEKWGVFSNFAFGGVVVPVR